MRDHSDAIRNLTMGHRQADALDAYASTNFSKKKFVYKNMVL